MPGATVGTSMGSGFPGTYAYNGDCVVKPYPVLSTDSAGPAFGNVVVLNQNSTGGTVSDAAVSKANGHTPVMTQGANYAVVGIAVREVRTLMNYGLNQPLTPLVQTVPPGQVCDVIERGAVSVIVKDPQSAGYVAGGKLYLRLVVNGAYPSAAVGDIETAADSSNTIQLTNMFLTSGIPDANGNSVYAITILNRNTP